MFITESSGFCFGFGFGTQTNPQIVATVDFNDKYV